MTNWTLGTAIVAMSVTTVIAQQPARDAGMPAKSDTMNRTFTGCIESVNHGGTFVLTKIDGDGKEPMHAAMADDTAVGLRGPVILAGAANLRKYTGQKVAVTGSLAANSVEPMHGPSTLTIRRLKVVAKSCS